MKKSALFIITAVITALMLTVSAFAGSYDDAFSGLTLTEFKAYADTQGPRGFGVDSKYYYVGYLQGTPTVVQYNAADGSEVAEYTFATEDGAYIKAIGTDDRGYVYMGIANKANDGAVYFAVCTQDGMKEITNVKIDIDGKVGVNGICTVKIDAKYYLYMTTNYDTDRVYRYDITDAKNPTADTSFGTNGYVDLSTLKITDPNNIAVASDGSIYIAVNTGNGSKGDSVIKLDAAGTKLAASAELKEAFGVCIVGEYVAACSFNGSSSEVAIYNQSDLSKVTSVVYPDAKKFAQLGLIGDKLYVLDSNDKIITSSPIKIPEKAVDTDKAPATADALSVTVLALAASAAAIVVAKKRH